jgi:hypothetical protein
MIAEIENHRARLMERVDEVGQSLTEAQDQNAMLVLDALARALRKAFKQHDGFILEAIRHPAYAVEWGEKAVEAGFAIEWNGRLVYALGQGRIDFEDAVDELEDRVLGGMFESRSTCGLKRGAGEYTQTAARYLLREAKSYVKWLQK